MASSVTIVPTAIFAAVAAGFAYLFVPHCPVTTMPSDSSNAPRTQKMAPEHGSFSKRFQPELPPPHGAIR
ncbi:hypothetical protein [Variovorax sp. SG517]|uniref:hypothetical protein n=1 Tax=unclassified Variovorax TaxID=663243 RepID=UPI00159E229F|nr:hypothetical protein [Variovorax sp. SG517]NVM92985.1 hypothetical protein [Variovorax sp. SG517]